MIKPNPLLTDKPLDRPTQQKTDNLKRTDSENELRDKTPNAAFGFNTQLWNVMLISWIIISIIGFIVSTQVETIPYSTFISDVQCGKISEVSIGQREIFGSYTPDQKRTFKTIKVDDPLLSTRLTQNHIKFQGQI